MTFQRYELPISNRVVSHTPQDYIAACGCTGKSTHYPTAALNQMAFGSSNNYGPGCGRCFKLTLLNSYTGTPPFFPNTNPSVVVKVTDLCPLSAAGWCSGTENKKNPYVLRLFVLQLHSSCFGNVLLGVQWLRLVCEEGRLTQGVVVGAVNTLILILHTHRPRFQTTSFPQTKSCTDTRHVFSLHNSPYLFCRDRLTRPSSHPGLWCLEHYLCVCLVQRVERLGGRSCKRQRAKHGWLLPC